MLDIFCLAAGFLIRATSGAVATGLFISPWFLLSTGLLALFLATEKRKAELKHSIDIGKIEREVLKRYSLPLLNRLENIVATSTFVSYMLWASGPVLNGAKSSLMLFTVPLVLIGIFRYQMLTDPDEITRRKQRNNFTSSEYPEEILLKDKGIKLISLSWLFLAILIGIIS